nr:phosphotransferase [sulfur-oxidizing endosymbiont of Gigantopelta aegis]
MAVYTSLSRIQIEQLLAPYKLGEIKHYEGISDGIENTNYRIITDTSNYILTIYEHFNAEEVPFYLQLLAFLRNHDIPVPEQVKKNQALGFWQEKPVAVFKCLPGQSLIKPKAHHCQQIGTALAQIHRIGQNFPSTQQNAWGAGWLQSTGKTLLSQLAKDDARLLQDELLFQQQYVLNTAHQSLPQGIIHADLFRDNALLSISNSAVF